MIQEVNLSRIYNLIHFTDLIFSVAPENQSKNNVKNDFAGLPCKVASVVSLQRAVYYCIIKAWKITKG